MARPILVSIAVAAVAIASAAHPRPNNFAAPAGAFPPAPAGNLAARILAAHNAERAAARVPPLLWDPALAALSLGYARQLAATGAFQHSDRRARRGVGENLWAGPRGSYPPERMVAQWTSERRRFRPGIFPAVSTTGNWYHVSHYTQVIWPATTRLGCGLATGRGRDVLVCRYAPAGNIDGRRVP